jgi:hypothetical protein
LYWWSSSASAKVDQILVDVTVIVRIAAGRKIGTTDRYPTQAVLDSIVGEVRPQELLLELFVQRVEVDSGSVGEGAAPSQDRLELLVGVYSNLIGGTVRLFELSSCLLESGTGFVGSVD